MRICTSIAFMLTLSLLNACTSKVDSAEYSKISASAILGGNAAPADKAEDLAKQAELLMTYQGFLQASSLVELALKQDPANFRAQFLQALLAPILEYKGMAVGLRPLAEKSPLLKNVYEEELKKEFAKPESAFKKYIFDGQADIESEEQLQTKIDVFAEKMENLRLFLKKAKVPEITMHANTLLVSDLNTRFAQACEIQETAAYEFVLKCPPAENRYDVTLNQADFSQLRDYVAMQEVQFLMYGAYDLSGMVEHVKEYPSDQNMTFDQILTSMMENPKFGRVRTNQKLKLIKEISLDFTSGMRDAIANQAKLCAGNYPMPKNRKGMLYNQGICVNSYALPYIKKLESQMSGQVFAYGDAPLQGGQTVNMLPTKFLEAPPADLRSLGPWSFDKCGNVTGVGEQTFGGVFPDGNANKLFEANRELCP